MASKKPTSPELTYDTKTILVVILLVTVYPVGLVLMFLWMKWSLWFKFLIAIPVALMLLAFFTLFMFVVVAIRSSVSVNQPAATYSLSECINQCSTVMDPGECAVRCVDTDPDDAVNMRY